MTPRRTSWRTVAAALAGALLALTACNDDTEASGTEPPSSSTPSLTESLSPEDRAIQQAEPVIRNYYEAYLAVLKDPARGPKRFEQVAKGQELRDLRAEWRQTRRNGWHATGRGRIDQVTITHADVESDPAVVEADVCYDVSDVGGVDQHGNSVLSPEREDKSLRRMRLTNDNWPEGQWMVSWTESKNESCA
jgi:hypothetical protein